MSTYSLTLRQNLSRPMTCQEMDDNLLYLEDIAKSQSFLNYSQTVGNQVTLYESTPSTIVSVEITTNGAPVQLTVERNRE